MRKLKLFFAACAAMVGLSASAQLTDGTVYWLQDASTGEFISQGADWGTQATVQDVGGVGFQVVYVSEDVYKLKNIMWNKVNNADLGLRVIDGYCDQSASDVTLTASGGGYLVGMAGGNYLCNNQSENSYGVKPLGLSTNSSDATVWKFLTKTEYDAAIQAYKDKKAASFATSLGYSAASVSALEAILAENYITKDYTSSITNAALNAGNTSGWTATKPNQRNQAFVSESGTMAEAWNGCAVVNQTVSGLPNGLFKVTFVGTFRPKGNTDSEKLTSEQTSSPAYVFANDAKEEFIHWIDVPAKANDRTGIKNNASAYTSSFYTYVTDGSLKLGVKQDTWYDGNMWCPFGHFTLTYYSDAVSDEDATAILSDATTLESQKMSVDALSALTSAKNTFDGARTIANYNALYTAVTNANASINSYASLLAAINNPSYTPAFPGGVEKYNDAISTAQGVYDAATIDDCTDAISALTNGINAAYEDDYSTFTGYAYDYSTLLSQDLTQWAKSDYVVMTADQHWNGKTGQRYYEQSGAEWGSSSWSHEASETPTLPAGNYVMSITARASADVTSTMSVKVGDNDAIIVSLANKGDVGRGVTTDGVGSFADGTYANTSGRGWEYRFIAFTVTEESPVTIKFNSSTNAQYNWVSIATPLLKGDVHPNQIKLNQVKNLVATLAEYEDDISAAAYATFATDITAANNATLESDNLDDIITALQSDIQTAKAVAEAYAAFNTTKTNALAVATGMESVTNAINIFAESVEGYTDAEAINADNTNVINLMNNYSVWCNIKDMADALVAVSNDNADANTTLANTITTDFNALNEIEVTDRTKAINLIESGSIISFASGVRTAMKTYVFAANPVGDGAKFDLTFMLTNPDLTSFWDGTWGIKPDGWQTEQEGGNFQVMQNNNVDAEDGIHKVFIEYYYLDGNNTTWGNGKFNVSTTVNLPVGTYTMSCYAFAKEENYSSGAANPQVYFYANDTQGSLVNSSKLTEQSISFVNDSEQDVKIGLKPLAGNTYNWMGIGYVQLFKVPTVTVTIDEDVAYTPESVAGKVTLKRTLATTKWNTFVVPFQITNDELKDAFGDGVEVAEYRDVAVDDNSTIYFDKMATPTITPNKPVLLKPATVEGDNTYEFMNRTVATGDAKVAGTNFDFVGSYAAKTFVTTGDYYLKDDQIYKSKQDDGSYIKGTRAYIKTKTPSARIINFVIDGEEVTAIEGLEVAGKNNGKLYNLAGQEVKNAQKGLYIQNGKKVIVK